MASNKKQNVLPPQNKFLFCLPLHGTVIVISIIYTIFEILQFIYCFYTEMHYLNVANTIYVISLILFVIGIFTKNLSLMYQYVIMGIIVLVVHLVELAAYSFIVAIGVGMADHVDENEKGFSAILLHVYPFIIIYLIELLCFILFFSYVRKFRKIISSSNSELPI